MKFGTVIHKVLIEGSVSRFFCLGLKPIFHQNAKYLASGTFASPNAKDSISASPNARIPTCWYFLR